MFVCVFREGKEGKKNGMVRIDGRKSEGGGLIGEKYEWCQKTEEEEEMEEEDVAPWRKGEKDYTAISSPFFPPL